ncbi:MAG TPA: hypothetical protein VG734_15510 [Lacunisphaera sp.]|nr:hypothetical protein [Lacunisphaera sp.]
MKARYLVAILCAAVLVGYFIGRSPSSKVEQSSAGPSSERATVVREDQASAPKDSVKAKLTEEPKTPRLRDPQVAVLAWAEDMKHGNVEAVARSIVLTTEARNVIEKAMVSAPADFTRKYPTPELLTAFVFCGAQRIEGFQIEAEKLVRPDYAVLAIAYKFESESEWRREEFGLERTPDGWKNVVGDALAARIAVIVGASKR